MEELKNEQTETTAQPATAEKDLGANTKEVSLGKFKDVNALIRAYNSLEAEFTKRCQRIKELEGANKLTDNATAPVSLQAVEKPEEHNPISDQDKERILKDYLKDVLGLKQKAILINGEGNGIKTPVSRPKTIDEAGALAMEYLK